MTLSSEERRELEEQFRRELQDEHERRVEKLEARQAKARSRQGGRHDAQRQIALSELKEQVREDFYKQNGYKLYTDSTGRDVWLTPEEYEYRMRRRKARRHRTIIEPGASQKRMWFVYAGLAVLAVVLGVALAH